MTFRIQEGLPFVTVTLDFRGRLLALSNVLLDTGSANSVFPTEKLLAIRLYTEPQDIVHRIRGAGGTEFVFTKQIESLRLDDLIVHDLEIEVGAMAYGIELDGILGFNHIVTLRDGKAKPKAR